MGESKEHLTTNQQTRLWEAYEDALNSAVDTKNGADANLIKVLIELGLQVDGIVDAYTICERIFGW